MSGTPEHIQAGIRAPARRLMMALCLLGLALAVPVSVDGRVSVLEKQRLAFVQAEHKLARAPWKAFARITKGIESYPLYAYLEQLALLKNLRSVSDTTLSGFLEKHRDLPIVFRLRRAWLRQLARRRKWDLYSTQYKPGDGRTFDCHYALALYHTGQVEKAWQKVANLWLTDHSLPDSCDTPLLLWRKAGQLTPDLAWQRALLSVKARNRQLVKYLRRFVPMPDSRLLELWLQSRNQPAVVHTLLAANGNRDRREALAAEILMRRAITDLDAVMRQWQKLDTEFTISPPQRDRIRQAIAIRLARNHRPEALDWLYSDMGDSPSKRLEHWRLATALWHQDWPRVLDIYSNLSAPERDQEKWRYWRARAMQKMGDNTGREELAALSLERSYYGFRAADVSSLPYHLGHHSQEINKANMERIAQRPDARRSRELLLLKRTVDARREWRQMLKILPLEHLATAAQLAHGWQWHNIVIATLAKSPQRDDLRLRFPLAFNKQITRAAKQSGLSPARIYSVIRQESAFMTAARSSAGAQGLMQILPTTARYVARKIHQTYTGVSSLRVPAKNLQLGSAYLKKLQDRFDDHPVLASAAYNAGPTRVRRWLPRHMDVSSDVWIENIPFAETREYLRRVLSYQLIYAHRLENTPIRMGDWMPDVPRKH